VLIAAAVVVGVATWVVLRGFSVVLSVAAVVACLTLMVAAYLLGGEREQRRSSGLLYVAAACLGFQAGPAVFGEVGTWVGAVTMWWALVPLGIVVLSYPGRRLLARWHGALLVVMGLDCVVFWAVAVALGGISPRIVELHWPGVGLMIMRVGFPILFCAALVQRWKCAAPPERPGVRSVCVVGLVLAVMFVARIGVRGLAELGIVSWSAYEAARTVNLVCLALALLGLLLEALRRRAAHGRLIENLLRVGGNPARIQDAIRKALNDPSAQLALHWPGGSLPLARPPTPSRVVRDLRTPEGTLVAVVDAAEETTRDPAQLRAVLAVGAVALDNARLQSQLAQKVDELRTSRSRIVEATVQSRRRLERDLHDGAQQQLLAVAATLARAELLGAQAGAASAVGEARRQLGEAIAELRRLARGIHPAILDRGGLPVALPSLADTVEVPVDVDVPTELHTRLAAPVETTLWFVAAEAMTNAARHSRAASIRLRLEAAAGRVTVTVADNGRGGARMIAGGGLAGLSDRVSALGGALRISSSATTGTCVEAALPCES
jgi:signal transduction histidine kinase